MKTFKTLLLTLTAVLLTGCYTQLQYTKDSNTSKPAKKQSAEGYSWTENDQNQNGNNKQADNLSSGQGQNVGLRGDCSSRAYKDNSQSQQEQNCDTINNYYLYNQEFSDWGRYSYYNSPYSLYNGFGNYNYPWYQYGYYPHRYYGSSFNVSLSWGYPYSRYYGYGSFGYPYRYSYHNLYAQSYYDFYNSSQGVWYPKNGSSDRSTRYGMRSIGTDRVNADRNRSRNRSVSGGRSAARSTKSGAVRNRSSVGTTRTKTVVRSRNSRDSQKENRNRGNGTVRSRNNSNNSYYSKEQLQRNARNRLESLETVSNNNQGNRRSTFFNRIKGFFGRTARNIGTSDDHSTFRYRGSSSRNSIHNNGSSSSGSGRSSVGRSRSSSSGSSSSATRSRNSSSSSRSRSSDDGGSSSQRSRGN